ncbi:Uncharacterised protein [Streptococcus pneumoniae]|nr:Uncharacterised protein [Streptococcus pneumoniae]
MTISLPTSASSFTFTLKMILLSFVSVIAGYFASILPFSNFSSTESVPAPSAFTLFSTYSTPSGKVSSIFTSASFPFSTVFLKLIRYSTSSPNFGNRLFTTFFASSFPSLYCGIISAFGVSGGCFVSLTIASLTIVLLTLPFTFTLKVILLSSISVISGYFASTLPFSTFNSTGAGLEPSACKLSFTYSNPFGKSSFIITSANFPCSTVFLKLIRYFTSSSNFGDGLFATFFASIFPSLYWGVISAFGLIGSCFVSSTIALLTIFSPTFTSSFTFTLKVILLSSISVISGYFASTFPFSIFNSTGFGPAPSAFKLFSTYSKPSGKVSSIFTSASFPFFTVFLKLIRYSTSSPNFGVSLFTLFFALIFPSLCNGVIFASGFFESFVSSTIA